MDQQIKEVGRPCAMDTVVQPEKNGVPGYNALLAVDTAYQKRLWDCRWQKGRLHKLENRLLFQTAFKIICAFSS
jgi:hypothetical protein